MTLNELRSALQAILDAEQAADVDWPKVEYLCTRTLGQLKGNQRPITPTTSFMFSWRTLNFGKKMRTTRTFSASD